MTEQIIAIKSHSWTKHIKNYKYCKASDICKWYFKVNNLECKKNYCTNQDCKCGSFTNGSLNIADKEIFYRNWRCCYKSLFFQCCQRGCACYGIQNSTIAVRYGKICHFRSKRNHKETSSGKCRVHKVLTESAKKLFYDNDSECTAQNWHPQWNLRRHIQREQKACYHCTEISNCIFFVHESVIQPFKKHTGNHCYEHYKECMKAEIPDTE